MIELPDSYRVVAEAPLHAVDITGTVISLRTGRVCKPQGKQVQAQRLAMGSTRGTPLCLLLEQAWGMSQVEAQLEEAARENAGRKNYW